MNNQRLHRKYFGIEISAGNFNYTLADDGLLQFTDRNTACVLFYDDSYEV